MGGAKQRNWRELTLRPHSLSPQGRHDGGTTGYARWMGPGEGKLWGDLRREL